MARTTRLLWVSALLFFVAALSPSRARSAPAGQAADSTDRALLEVVATALEVAADAPEFWPAYSLADRPLLVYRPGGWAALVNPPESDHRGWQPYSGDWPALPVPALVRAEGIEGLIGQLFFDYEIPGGRTVAVPLYEAIPAELGARDRYLYAFLTHEAFHQHQREAFADVNTPAEETYPILDPQNNARAAQEMKVLEEAVAAVDEDDLDAARLRAEEAVAIHRERWRLLGDRARAIEVGKEVVEGTAKYVETRSVAELGRLCRKSEGLTSFRLCSHFRELTPAAWISEDLALRLEGGAVSPRDMPRNRIYPVGAALGLLLDVFQPGWKDRVQEMGTTRGLHERLDEALSPLSSEPAVLIREARRRHGWSGILAASRQKIEAYRVGFEEALEDFRGQAGTRVIVELPARGLSRSRTSREQRWVVDRGRVTLGRFVTYTLRRTTEPDLHLAVRNRSILDESLEGERRRVVFFTDEIGELTLDGRASSPDDLDEERFRTLELAGKGLEAKTSLGGMLERSGGTLTIRLLDPQG